MKASEAYKNTTKVKNLIIDEINDRILKASNDGRFSIKCFSIKDFDDYVILSLRNDGYCVVFNKGNCCGGYPYFEISWNQELKNIQYQSCISRF